ncbi:MAG: polysaccharide biosynthesis C-terminal domain-containing protein, partial [Clostridia bacterium]|nr:polysaccharide biosynthesis C-terminal domain-containing protein [Clostridia bacterium]
PTTIITPFAVSIIPTISGSLGNRENLKKTMDFTFRIVSMICLPCAFGLGVMAKPIISMFFSNSEIFRDVQGTVFLSNQIAAPMLTILAPAVAFSGLITVSSAILQASGHEKKSILSTLCGVGTKAVTVLVLVGTKAVSYFGIPVSTLLSYLVMFCFNMFFLSHTLNYRLSFRKLLFKPLCCAILCGVTAGASYALLIQVLPNTLATIGGILIAGLVYALALFLTKTIQKEDLLFLPKGEKLFNILNKLHLIH